MGQWVFSRGISRAKLSFSSFRPTPVLPTGPSGQWKPTVGVFATLSVANHRFTKSSSDPYRLSFRRVQTITAWSQILERLELASCSGERTPDLPIYKGR